MSKFNTKALRKTFYLAPDIEALCDAYDEAQVEIESLRENLKEAEKSIYNLVFAYANKDQEMPHDFEMSALKDATEIVTDSHDSDFVQAVYEDARSKYENVSTPIIIVTNRNTGGIES